MTDQPRTDANLKPVYAVQRGTDHQGRPLYEPRSQAMLTVDSPKLWVKRRDAERWAARNNAPGRVGRVVEFALLPVPVETEEAPDA